LRLSRADPWQCGVEPGTPIHWGSDHAAGLVALWPMWEGGGQSFQDVANGLNAVVPAGHPNSVKLAAGELWAAPYVPNALGQAGATDYPTFPQSGLLNLPTFTVSYRARLDAGGGYKGVLSCRNSGQAGFQCTTASTSSSTYQPFLVAANSAGTEVCLKKISATIALPMARFSVFVWTWDGVNARCWIDGVEQTVIAGGDSGFGATGNRFFSAFNAAVGSFYDFRIYNYPRPELGPELYDPATRWKVFESPRLRVFLLGAPTFTVAGGGGLVLSSASTPSAGFQGSSGGGPMAGGLAAQPDIDFFRSSSGGVVLGGHTTDPPQPIIEFTATSSAGPVVGGTFAPSVSFTATSSAGPVVGGAAQGSLFFSVVAGGGGVVLGGHTTDPPQPIIEFTAAPSGGPVVGGATLAGPLEFTAAPSGGVLLGGTTNPGADWTLDSGATGGGPVLGSTTTLTLLVTVPDPTHTHIIRLGPDPNFGKTRHDGPNPRLARATRLGPDPHFGKIKRQGI
jgi:hypothetical protein